MKPLPSPNLGICSNIIDHNQRSCQIGGGTGNILSPLFVITVSQFIFPFPIFFSVSACLPVSLPPSKYCYYWKGILFLRNYRIIFPSLGAIQRNALVINLVDHNFVRQSVLNSMLFFSFSFWKRTSAKVLSCHHRLFFFLSLSSLWRAEPARRTEALPCKGPKLKGNRGSKIA